MIGTALVHAAFLGRGMSPVSFASTCRSLDISGLVSVKLESSDGIELYLRGAIVPQILDVSHS